MVKNIRRLWTDGSVDMEVLPSPLTVDDFATHFMLVPKQMNGLVEFHVLPFISCVYVYLIDSWFSLTRHY